MRHPTIVLGPDPAGTGADDAPESVYIQRRAEYAHARESLAARSAANGTRNVILFFGALLAVIVGVWNAQPLFYALALLIFVAFVIAFRQHGALNQRLQRQGELCAIYDESLARLRRDWEHLPLRLPPGPPPDDPLASDLDVFGRASLQHLLDSAATTAAGQALLRGWLLHPAAPAVVGQRQVAVAELAPQLAFREELAVDGRLLGTAQAAYERFLEWAESAPWLSRHPPLLWIARVSAVLAIALALGQVVGLLPYPFWLLPIALNVLLVQTAGRRVDELLDEVADRQSAFAPYAELYHAIATHVFTAPELRRVQAELTTGDVSGAVEMRRLGRIMQLTDFRLSMFYPLLQAATLWSFHGLARLERWKLRAGAHARAWLGALAEMDALAALAALAYDAPTWAYPVVSAREPHVLEARNLGHPLLPPAACVGNDVRVGPPGTFLLVTGSNMSGKSTLLRALGANAVLAQMGGPVCATALRLPPLRLATSIRVQDSLEQGVSYFMAELRRLKLVVDAADAMRRDGGPVILYLLDEILHGTNTSERQIAARDILRHLLATGAIGAASTHDLTLADAPDLTAHATLVHFTEQFTRGPDGPMMTFDYRLRPGQATSSNALKLMEIVGLRGPQP